MNEKSIISYIESVLVDELSINCKLENIDVEIRSVGVDSIALMALIVYLENEYDIVCDSLFENYEENLSFRDIVNVVIDQVEE